MTLMDRPGCAEGVGVMYHPFLHDYLLERAELFDFIELPLDLYTDAARSALLDPGQARLRQVIAAKPCAWRGSALSLASVPLDGEPAFPPYTVQTIRRLLEMTPAACCTEVMGYRSQGQTTPYPVPFTAAAANWIARRQAEAQAALGVPVQLALPSSGGGANATGWDGIAFLDLISAHGATGIVVDAGDGDTLPASHVAALSLSSDDALAWDRLVALAAHVKPRTIVLCRNRQLFPLDTIERDLRRARSLIAEPGHQPQRTDTVTPSDRPDSESLATLRSYPVEAGTGATDSWRNWRNQVDDMHKAQQIAALMSRGGGAAPPWRT